VSELRTVVARVSSVREAKAADVVETFHQGAAELDLPASTLTDNGATFTAESRNGEEAARQATTSQDRRRRAEPRTRRCRAATDTSVRVATAFGANNAGASAWKRLRQAKNRRLRQVWE
jgi:hypothetical protein